MRIYEFESVYQKHDESMLIFELVDLSMRDVERKGISRYERYGLTSRRKGCVDRSKHSCYGPDLKVWGLNGTSQECETKRAACDSPKLAGEPTLLGGSSGHRRYTPAVGVIKICSPALWFKQSSQVKRFFHTTLSKCKYKAAGWNVQWWLFTRRRSYPFNVQMQMISSNVQWWFIVWRHSNSIGQLSPCRIRFRDNTKIRAIDDKFNWVSLFYYLAGYNHVASLAGCLRETVPYLEFHKGGKFSLATSAHSKREQTMFSCFSYGETLFCQGGHVPFPPLNTKLEGKNYRFLHFVRLVCMLIRESQKRLMDTI